METAHFVIGRSRVQLSPSAPNSKKTKEFLKSVTYRRASLAPGSIKVPSFFSRAFMAFWMSLVATIAWRMKNRTGLPTAYERFRSNGKG
jgi:hypothetical protein